MQGSSLTIAFSANLAQTELFINHALIMSTPEKRETLRTTFSLQEDEVAILQKMHKASCFLVLYNLMESTARLVMEVIAAHINRSGLAIGNLPPTLRRSLIRGLFKDHGRRKIEDIALELLDLACQQAALTAFPSTDIQQTSGNVDARWIRALAECYGFSVDCREDARGGSNLATVKNRRNGLAHGNYSFAECGSEYSTEEVMGICRSTISYLTDIISNVEVFLTERQFSLPKN